MIQYSAISPPSILAIAMCLFISSNIIRGFLSSCYRFSAQRFPASILVIAMCLFISSNIIRESCLLAIDSVLGVFPASILAIVMCLFISSNIIRGFLSSCYRFSTRRFPRRVISHPYCYVHYDVLDTTCVIGCLMNDILILFLCLLSPMLFGVFLIYFSLVFADFSASFPTSTKKTNTTGA